MGVQTPVLGNFNAKVPHKAHEPVMLMSIYLKTVELKELRHLKITQSMKRTKVLQFYGLEIAGQKHTRLMRLMGHLGVEIA